METVKLSVLDKDVLENKDIALTTIATAIYQYIERHVSEKTYGEYLETSDELTNVLQQKLQEIATMGAMVKLSEELNKAANTKK